MHTCARSRAVRFRFRDFLSRASDCCYVAVLALTLIGIEDDNGPQLYKTDPAGYFVGFKACAVGQKDSEAQIFLEKKLRNAPQLTADETIRVRSVSCCRVTD